MLVRFLTGLLLALLIHGVQAAEPLILVTDDWPPYEYRDENDGRLVGLATETVRAVFQHLQWPKPEIRLQPWARAEREALAGTVDGIFSITPNPQRLGSLYFPDEPLAEEQGVIFYRRDSDHPLNIEQLADLKRLNVGVVRGYAYSAGLWMALNDFGNFTQVTGEDQLFQMLSRGRFDAVISYRHTGLEICRRLGLLEQIASNDSFVLFTHRFYLAFNRERVAQRQAALFSQALADFKRSDEYRLLRERYIVSP